MSTAKEAAAKAAGRPREPKTWGTRKAAEIRAKCNKLTRVEREALLERAMRIAYGTDAPVRPQVAADRSAELHSTSIG